MELQVRETEQPIRTILESFFRQKVLFLCLFVLVVAGVSISTLRAKREYPSTMEFLLENNRPNSVIAPDRGPSASQAEISEQLINSELEVIQSEDVISEVADPQWSALPLAKRKPNVVKAHEDAVRDFQSHLTVSPIKSSNVIEVGFTAESPAEATQTLERLSAAYLAARKRLSRPRGTADFYVYEANSYQDAWRRANAELVAFQQEHKLVSVQEGQQVLSKEIADYETQVHENDANLAAMDRRLTQARETQAAVAPRQHTQAHTILNQVSTEGMRSLLVQLQNRRTELLTRYNASDPLVIEVNRQIAETTASLNEARTQKGTEDTTDVNPTWQQLATTIAEAQVDKNALMARKRSLLGSVASLHDDLSKLQSLDARFNELQETADQARSNFEIFSQKRDQAQIEDAMDERQLVNVAVVQAPTLAFRPASPKRLQNVALGTLSAMFIAMGAVYFVESARATISTPRELERLSRYPVLATARLIPRSPRRNASLASGGKIILSHSNLLDVRLRFGTVRKSTANS